MSLLSLCNNKLLWEMSTHVASKDNFPPKIVWVFSWTSAMFALHICAGRWWIRWGGWYPRFSRSTGADWPTRTHWTTGRSRTWRKSLHDSLVEQPWLKWDTCLKLRSTSVFCSHCQTSWLNVSVLSNKATPKALCTINCYCVVTLPDCGGEG